MGVNGNLFPPRGKAVHYRRMGTYNPWARLADMDRDTIDVAVIYPTDELPLTVTPDVGFAAARARAYNDWLFEYCQVCPQRLKGIGIVPLQDVDMAHPGNAPCRDGAGDGRHPDWLHRARGHTVK